MRPRNWTAFVLVACLALAPTASARWAVEQATSPGSKAKVELPPPVARAIEANRPGAEIDTVDVEKEAGITLYDVEFKADQGEIDVAEDGTVMDIATVIEMKDVPAAAADAIRKAAIGARIERLERSEIRAEIVEKGGKGAISKLATPRYAYEAELVKGDRTGEIQVAPDGQVVEKLKWSAKGAQE